jgi:hypothetical protein
MEDFFNDILIKTNNDTDYVSDVDLYNEYKIWAIKFTVLVRLIDVTL